MNYSHVSVGTHKQTNITQTQKRRSRTRPQGNTHQGMWEGSELLKSTQ